MIRLPPRGQYSTPKHTLIGIDKIVARLRLTKQNWNLPAGQTTNVRIGTEWAGNIQFISKVVNGDELYREIPEGVAEDGGGFKVTTILGTDKQASAIGNHFPRK